MTLGSGLDLIERPVTAAEAGRSPRACADLVVAVIRGKDLLNYADPRLDVLRAGDRVITVSRPVQTEAV
jgi:voltage-gated potassium channel